MRSEVITWLNKNVSEKRVKHILGVEQTAKELAQLYGVDEKKAAIAGLMHDLAKFFSPKRLLEIADLHKINLDPIYLHNPHLLHAEASAIVAQQKFGIQDAEILSAIRNHTLGSPEMNLLDCIVFVADAIEPNRGNDLELEKIRQISQNNIYQGVAQSCDYSLKYLINTFHTIHPRMILTRNWAVSLVKSQINIIN